MRGASGLRHQLVTGQQRDVFDYWSGLAKAKARNADTRHEGAHHASGLPTRDDIDPARIARQLPFISLFEQDRDGRFDVRLAGTGFWNFFGSEISGRRLDDLPLGEGCSYWHRVLSHVCATGQPMAGTTTPNTPQGGHLRQFWLRLPLASERGPVVLGFDQFLRAPSETGERKPSRLMRPVFGTGAPLLVGA